MTFRICNTFLFAAFILSSSFLAAAEKDGPLTEGEHAGSIDLLNNASLDDFDFFLLDNGKKDEVFSINNGVLKVSGTPFGWLGTKKDYYNFTISLEFRLLSPEKESNSGFLVRMGAQKPTTFVPHCVEIGIYEKETGTIFGFHDFHVAAEESRMVYYKNHEFCGNCDQVNFFSDQIKDLTDWNQMTITCSGNVIIVEINGERVNWGLMADDYAGKVAFQSEGAEIEFRNAFLTVLP